MGHFIGKRELEDDGEQGCPGNEKVFNWCQALPHRQGLDCINSIATSNLFQEGGEPQVAATRQGDGPGECAGDGAIKLCLPLGVSLHSREAPNLGCSIDAHAPPGQKGEGESSQSRRKVLVGKPEPKREVAS